MRTNNLNSKLRNFLFVAFQLFVVSNLIAQTKFYFYSGGTNANNGFSVNTGGSWSTVNYPTYTDAENLTNPGCLSMNCNATITGGIYLNSSGSNLSLWSPKWISSLGATYEYYGQRIYADFTSSNSATSYATVVYTFTSSGSAINLPITFDLFDINSGAYTLDLASTANFIDYVQITARTSAGVNVNPIFSNQCGSPTDEFGTNTIKGNNSCGASPTRDVTVSFGQAISELTIKYMPGVGEPGNIAAATTTGTGFPILSTYDPGRQYIDISPIRVGSISPSISLQPSNASICTTGSATLSLTASSGPYQWQYNNAGTWQNVANSTPSGTTYSGQTTNSLTISASNVAAGTYSYRCVVGASCSSVTSSTATLTISSVSTTGMVANNWVWTGAQSTTYETAGNWLVWNGSTFSIPAAAPTSSNSVRIKPVAGCVSNSPVITTTTANCNSITIEASAQLTSNNSTNLSVSGNWSNSGNYIEQNGKITFSGTTQSISSSTFGGETFYDLTVNSGAVVTNSQDVSVSNGLRLNGVISTGSNRLLVTTTATDGVSTGIVDGNYVGQIVGNFRRTIQSNTATYRFPMGVTTTPTSGRRLLEFINNSITGVGYLDCSVSASFKGTGNNVDAWLSTTNAVMGTGPFLIQSIHDEGQWRLTPNSPPTGGNYGIRLFTQNFATLSGKDNQFTVLKRQDGSTTFADYSSFNGTTTIPSANTAGRIYNSGSGYAERSGFTSFSEFVIGSYSTAVVLGVELQGYTIGCADNGYDLNFSTASENNASHFDVLESYNGISFNPVRTIQAVGTTSNVSNYYAFLPRTDANYLKLDQFDVDGTKTSLLISSLPVCSAPANPFISLQNDFLYLVHYQKANFEVDLLNAEGRLVWNQEINVEDSPKSYSMNVGGLAAGSYVMIIRNKEKSNVIRFNK